MWYRIEPTVMERRGDNVHVHIPPAVQSAVDALSIDWGSRILYEDADLLAVDKPSGVASAPAPGEMGEMLGWGGGSGFQAR